MADTDDYEQYSNISSLTSDELMFLDKATGNVNDDEDDDSINEDLILDKEPRFPWIITSIFGAIGIIVFMIALYSMSYLSKYSELLNNDTIKALSAVDSDNISGIDSMRTLAGVYSMRGALYAAIIMIFIVIIGAILLIWLIRHNSWEKELANIDFDDIEDDDSDASEKSKSHYEYYDEDEKEEIE